MKWVCQPHHFNTMNTLDGWVSLERNFADELKKGCTRRVTLLRVKRRITQKLNAINYFIKEGQNKLLDHTNDNALQLFFDISKESILVIFFE